ncbi:AraC family transcriptional regulator [Massilia violaceinigra]|uniref:AraC family transcriptional regulator n=1 Tax=Massilia violaceinigra TaxID=2045208 RepID=A0A2D2DNN2_9BURK|nr:AraC family transcriptional regulator [Massilia violaceinigra]ATQ76588.1 AraC family transcriptional regulator [Massilia violaceinigra]
MPTPPSRQDRMIALLGRLAPSEGYTASALDDVRFMRANRAVARVPVLYEPCIVIVCQGRKRGYLGEQSFIYDAQQFLVLSVPLPFESETDASEAEPLLALKMHIDLAVAAELALALGPAPSAHTTPVSMCSTAMDEAMGDAVLRLLEVLLCPVEARVLGPGILREILYRVLTGEQGGSVRAALAQHSQFGKIGKALRRIHAGFSGELDVPILAHEAGMSVAAFHANFKAVTQTSPIQYLKSTRLHKARLLMVQEGMSASSASNRVGYESSSQFSREFKRFFGRSPVQEAAMMKTLLSQAPSEPPGYVSAH